MVIGSRRTELAPAGGRARVAPWPGWLLALGLCVHGPGGIPARVLADEETPRRPAEAQDRNSPPLEGKETRGPREKPAEIEEIEAMLGEELDKLEARLRSLRDRLRRLSISPGAANGPSGPGRLEDRDAEAYRSLLKRQDALLEQWRGLGRAVAPRPDLDKAGKERRGNEPKAREKGRDDRVLEEQRMKIRAELRVVLSAILDLRERSRNRQLERLRAELQDLEQSVKARQQEKERRQMIESRLRDLLGEPEQGRR